MEQRRVIEAKVGDEKVRGQGIVVAGAGYAGLRVTQRLGSWLPNQRFTSLTVVDKHPYHQLLTELPRVIGGTRDQSQVEVPVKPLLSDSVTFIQSEVTGFDLANQCLETASGVVAYWRLVLALGSRPNDFEIPGLADRAMFMWSSRDAVAIQRKVEEIVTQAAGSDGQEEQRRLLTVVVGGGGATGVELAGALAEELPEIARRKGASAENCRVVLVESGPSILVGSSPELIKKAMDILQQLYVRIYVNSAIVEATSTALRLKNGNVVEGGVFIWAGGVKAPEITQGSGFQIGYNGRIKVDRYLKALDHGDIYVAGDLASVPDPETGLILPPLAQTALGEGEAVAANLKAELEERPLQPFDNRKMGIAVSLGERRGVSDIAGLTLGGRLAHLLKDTIEWEYRQSIKHLRGWSPI